MLDFCPFVWYVVCMNLTQAQLDWLANEKRVHDSADCKSNLPFDPAWGGHQRRWQAYTTGNLYALSVQNRTMSHSFVVHQYGKNAWQAALRYYKGLSGKGGTWVWTCTKVVSAKLLSS